MTLLDSLLDAIVRLEGDALVMHVGEKPYVVTTSSAMSAYRGPLAWGQVELSSRVLTPDAVLSMVGQILPADQRHALDEVGAVEHEIASPQGVSDRFSVVAARGGDDIWLELRRHPPAAAAAVGDASPSEPQQVPSLEAEPAAEKASDRSVSTAVGLQEPPEEASASADAPAPAEAASTAGDVDRSETPPAAGALDEPPRHEAEDVEGYVVALQASEDDEAARQEAPLELVEAEAQHAPTDADVDAMLAATAASLLSASLKSDDESSGGPEPREEGSAAYLTDTFEIVMEEEEEQEEEKSEAFEDLDLTSALDGMPPAARSLVREEAAPAPEAEPVADADGAGADAGAAPAIPDETVAPAAPPAIQDETAAPAEPAPVSEIDAAAPPPVEAPPVEAPSDLEQPLPSAPPVAPAVPAPEVGDTAARADEEQAPPPPEAPVRPQSAPEEAPGGEVPGLRETPVDIIAALPGTGAVAPQPSIAPSIAAAVREPQGRPDTGAPTEDERLLPILRVAAERGASTIYVVAQSKPMLRVDGEIAALEDEPALTADGIERLVAALAPRDAGTSITDGAEWMTEVAGIGRVRCVAFRDHRGPGAIFRLIPAKSISADHLNLSPEIRELCTLADGLVLVAGARGSGRSTLLNSFVDLINGTRSEHLVTVESEIAFVHESRRSFVSQRETRGDAASAAAAVHAALREDPDVLVVEDVQSPEVAMAALHAAGSGRLVFASIAASSSAAALEGLMNLVPEPERAAMRGALAGALRGVVTQALVKKASGGRAAARELLLNSPAVASAVRNGDMQSVAAGLDAGQRHGMVPLTEALAALVRGGTVHASEACRRAPDRQPMLAALARDGVDTSFAERLA